MRTAFLLLTITGLAAGAKDIDLAHHFRGVRGTFVLLDAATAKWTRYNPERAAQQFTPCSTFKIPNSAIAIESGVAPDSDFTVAYDPKRDHAERPEWARDHNLRSAFQYSVVWYYQEMARRAGPDRMAKYVRQFHYGNEDTSGGVDHFWLGSTLRISADEQVDFLKRFYEQKLALSGRTTRIVKEIMVADRGQSSRLSAKTGACRVDANEVVLWYVGYVEKDGRVYYFALNMGDKDYDPLFSQRVTKARTILTELGILD